jgi:hypothetical protein
MSTMITSRTTADAVREDAYLMEPVTHAEYLAKTKGLAPENEGDLSRIFERYRLLADTFGVGDPYMADDGDE